ncbi:MAG: hypothetical protein WBL40_08285, partial [Terrimicrobiaceae bacterium]
PAAPKGPWAQCNRQSGRLTDGRDNHLLPADRGWCVVDLYPWIVFLHVVGVLLFFIAHGTSMAVGFRLKRERDPARVRALLELTDRKSLLALRGVGPESEAESVRFHGRRVTKVGPGVKHGLSRVAGADR